MQNSDAFANYSLLRGLKVLLLNHCWNPPRCLKWFYLQQFRLAKKVVQNMSQSNMTARWCMFVAVCPFNGHTPRCHKSFNTMLKDFNIILQNYVFTQNANFKICGICTAKNILQKYIFTFFCWEPHQLMLDQIPITISIIQLFLTIPILRIYIYNMILSSTKSDEI